MAHTAFFDALQAIDTEIEDKGGTILVTGPEQEEFNAEEEDIFQCGKCKKQFYEINEFLKHKKTHQLANVSNFHNLAASSINDSEIQLDPIIINEQDMLSFNLTQTSFNLTSDDQVLADFQEPEPLLDQNPGMTEPFNLSNAFELVLTTQEPEQETVLMTESQAGMGQLLDLNNSIICLDSVQLVDVCLESYVEESENHENNLTEVPAKSKESRKVPKQNKVLLKCPHCTKAFAKNFDFNQHLRSHTGEQPFICVICGRTFTQKSNVKKHMETHKVWPQNITTLAEKPIKKRATSLTGEVRVIDKSFVCQYCPETFSTYLQLKIHRNTHADRKVFKCIQTDCSEEFQSLDTFLEHITTHNNNGSTNQFRCFSCRQEFLSLIDLVKHRELNEPCRNMKNGPLKCKLCKATFSSILNLESHEKEDPHYYPCPECTKVYVTEKRLRRHLNVHSSDPAFKCEECGKYFGSAQNLSSHKLVHSSEKPYVCLICSASFARHDRLMRHTFKHDPSRRLKCPFSKHLGCKREFYRKDKLKEHMVTHLSSKNLKCPNCNRVFKRTSQLKRHETICLSEDRPCKDCGHITTSLENYKKKVTGNNQSCHVNRRKHRLLEAARSTDDGVQTLQVVVVPLDNLAFNKV